MEKEKTIGLPPDFEHPLILHKGLSEQNDLESCKYKLEVCEDLLNLKGFNEDYAIQDEYFDRVPVFDEFFGFLLEVECRWSEYCQEDEYYRLWFWFLRQSIKELKYTIAVKLQELKKSENGSIQLEFQDWSGSLTLLTTKLVMAKWFDELPMNPEHESNMEELRNKYKPSYLALQKLDLITDLKVLELKKLLMESYNGNTSDITDNSDTSQENVVPVHPIDSMEDYKDLGKSVNQSVIPAHKMNIPVEKVSLKLPNSIVSEYNDVSLKVSESMINLPNIKEEINYNINSNRASPRLPGIKINVPDSDEDLEFDEDVESLRIWSLVDEDLSYIVLPPGTPTLAPRPNHATPGATIGYRRCHFISHVSNCYILFLRANKSVRAGTFFDIYK